MKEGAKKLKSSLFSKFLVPAPFPMRRANYILSSREYLNIIRLLAMELPSTEDLAITSGHLHVQYCYE